MGKEGNEDVWDNDQVKGKGKGKEGKEDVGQVGPGGHQQVEPRGHGQGRGKEQSQGQGSAPARRKIGGSACENIV